MEKTTIEWLEQEFLKLEATVGVHGKIYELLEQAKEMEKQQMKDAFLDGNKLMVNLETYGSKGSDKEEQKKLITEIMNEDAKDGLYETEISEKDINKAADEFSKNFHIGYDIKKEDSWYGFIEGVRWYKNQIRK